MATIGIDLGTTNSLVAVLDQSGPRTLANELGEHLTPSAVALATDGTVLVGRAAKDRLISAPDSGKEFFKRDMGTAATYTFGGRTWTPTECSAMVLREMARIAATHLGETPTSAVISVPAYFHDSQRQATMEAAKIAGLQVERIINEPTAAALAFGHEHRQKEGTLLVFDLGGGTFDVTILEVFDGVIEVKASGGESRLGGEDYTDALMAHVVTLLPGADPVRLRPLVEVAKRRLAAQPEAVIALGGKDVRVTREDFARCTRELTGRLRPVMRRCLRDANLQASDLDDVLLVGGASRMPMIAQVIGEDLGRLGNRTLDPDKVVALGAAVQAALCDRQEAVQDLVLTDVCPHTLGVAVSKRWTENGPPQDGFFSPIIDRNTLVPCSRSDRYNTMHPEQDQLELKVYQGESRLVIENTLLGTLMVKGLRQRMGQKEPGVIDVRFSYDMNGILEVEVVIVHSGAKLTKVIESRPGGLTDDQLAAAVRRLQPLKTLPRDLLPNRARLERANRLYPDLSGAAREGLASRIDDFESALDSQDPRRAQEAAAVLDSFLAHFYHGEGEQQPEPDPQTPQPPYTEPTGA